MNEEIKAIWKSLFDWVMGNGPRPENEVIPDEPPPDLPFTRKPKDKYSRFHEATLKERYNQWLEIHGLHMFSSLYSGISVLTCIVIVSLLLATVSELPSLSDERNLANNEVIRRYVERGGKETGAQNIVAGLILNYRAFNTFGESAVLFTAAVSVLMLLGASRRNNADDEQSMKGNDSGKNFMQRGPPSVRLHTFRRDDAILRGTASISIPVILIMGCVIIINGHLLSGGAILSTALILCANAYDFERVHKFFNEQIFITITSTSLMIYALSNIFNGGLILLPNICIGLIVAGTLYGFYALLSEGEI